MHDHRCFPRAEIVSFLCLFVQRPFPRAGPQIALSFGLTLQGLRAEAQRLRGSEAPAKEPDLVIAMNV